ncbi:hypothetical protein FQR65_LT14340 [Abscondita terminalis]|nr:hypothetical protein FQR65_LT14340 [Abscondita terminalis]
MALKKMYVKWKLLLSFGTIFWITLCLYDTYFIDPATKFYYSDSDEYGWLATVSEDEINTEAMISNSVERMSENKYSFGEYLLFWNVLIFLSTVVFCLCSKLITNHLWLKNKTKEIFHNEVTKKTAGSKIPIFSIGPKSISNFLGNTDYTVMRSSINLDSTPSKDELTSKYMEKQCAKLRDDMISVHSSSIKENATISKKLEAALREKRELCKKLNAINKESTTARQQVDQLLNEKCSLLERLDCASKEFKQNTKSKKAALAKLEESQANVALLMKEVERYQTEKSELENRFKQLDIENQQLKECFYSENGPNHDEVKSLRFNFFNDTTLLIGKRCVKLRATQLIVNFFNDTTLLIGKRCVKLRATQLIVNFFNDTTLLIGKRCVKLRATQLIVNFFNDTTLLIGKRSVKLRATQLIVNFFNDTTLLIGKRCVKLRATQLIVNFFNDTTLLIGKRSVKLRATQLIVNFFNDTTLLIGKRCVKLRATQLIVNFFNDTTLLIGKRCVKLRDDMISVHSSSIKENATISKKLEAALREKRELCKKLNAINKESTTARQQVDQLLNEKCSLLERLDCASKEFKQNTKSKKAALAKLEESQANVALLMKEVERYQTEKSELENRFKQLDIENQQLKECFYSENGPNHDEVKSLVIDQEKLFNNHKDDVLKNTTDDNLSQSHKDVQKVQKRLSDLEKSLDKLKITNWNKRESKKQKIQPTKEIFRDPGVNLPIPTIPESPLELPLRRPLTTDNLTDEQRQNILIPGDYYCDEFSPKIETKDEICGQKINEFGDSGTNFLDFRSVKGTEESSIDDDDEDEETYEWDSQGRIISNSPAFQRFLHKMDKVDKIRKPLMEKKRRARINDSLETLKQILLDSKTTLKESTQKKNGQRTAKLEKADILEMTVRYLQHLHNKLGQIQTARPIKSKEVSIRPADSSSESQMQVGVTLIPTRLENGDLAFVMPSSLQTLSNDRRDLKDEFCEKLHDGVWRPW